MEKIKGFTDSETFTRLPDTVFQNLLSQIDDIAELKVTLYFLWRLEHMQEPLRALNQADFEAELLGLSPDEIAAGLQKAHQRGVILRSQHDAQVLYFLNSPRGRAASEAFATSGMSESLKVMSSPVVVLPNVFKLYEQNIGPLTPVIADALKDSEHTYSQEWVVDAIEIAVKNNKRSWRYIEAILKRWKDEGRAEKQDRQDPEKDRRKYIEGDYSDFIEH